MTELPKRVHPRLRGYDYSRSGVYFLTLCTQNRLPILSEIVGRGIPDAPLVQLSETGRCVQDAMDYLAGHDAQIQIAASVIMPNHVHILLCVCGEGNGASGMPRPTAHRFGLPDSQAGSPAHPRWRASHERPEKGPGSGGLLLLCPGAGN